MKKIIIGISIFVALGIIGMSSYFLFKKYHVSSQTKGNKEVSEGKDKDQEGQDKGIQNVEKNYNVNSEFNEDFFKNVWKDESIMIRIKKIDGIKKYIPKKSKKDWPWLTTDQNIKNGIKKPDFTNKEIGYKYGDIDVKAEVSLKENSWIIDKANGRITYIVTLKYGNLKRDVKVVYWTIEKARRWLRNVDAEYLKHKRMSVFSEEQIAMWEYISDFGIQYPVLSNEQKNKKRRIFPAFHNKWLYLADTEKAFPVVFISNRSYSSIDGPKEYSLSIKYKVSIHNYPIAEDGDSKEIDLLYSTNQIPSKQKKFISFKDDRKKASSRITLNKSFKTKKEIMDYLKKNYSARKNDWMEITNSNSEMLIMNNITLGNNFRLKFEDRDASFIDWRGVEGINKINNPFKAESGIFNGYTFAFSNLSGLDFSNLKNKDFAPVRPGRPLGKSWVDQFGFEFVYKKEIVKN